MADQLTWEPPGPGPWQQDKSHMPLMFSRVAEHVFCEGLIRGFGETFARYGALLDGLNAAMVNVLDEPGQALEASVDELVGLVQGAAGPAAADLAARTLMRARLGQNTAPALLGPPSTGESFNAMLHLVGAIVTDHGSFASHAAIMPRELGFPAVVGTVDGTARIRDGAIVRVDGTTGEVHLVA